MKSKSLISVIIAMLIPMASNAKTLIAYYSYTNNVHTIVTALRQQLADADVVRIEPAEKGLDYAADNYAIGSAQIAAIRANPDDAASYPAIDPVELSAGEYDTVIIATPLWWSNMAAPMQTFLFQHAKEIGSANIGLIVSSASSGISGVEADSHRLLPDGHHLTPSLWIRSQQTSDAARMLADWLGAIGYDTLPSSIGTTAFPTHQSGRYTVYNMSGQRLMADEPSLDKLSGGIYIINGEKTVISR